MAQVKLDVRRKAATVAILVAAGTLAGPFGTYEDLGPIDRFVYWAGAILACGLVMEFLLIAALTHPLLRLPGWARLALAVFVGSFPAALAVLGLEYGLRGNPPEPAFAVWVWLLVVGVAALVSLVEYREVLRPPATVQGAQGPVPSASRRQDAPQPATPRGDTRPGALFLRNLDPDLGDELVSLSKQDHYLEVVTRQGQALILKRMSDAVAELDRYPGLQIHRSHWVALDAVADIGRENGRAVVRLDDGRNLPVSRPNVAPLRAELSARADRDPEKQSTGSDANTFE